MSKLICGMLWMFAGVCWIIAGHIDTGTILVAIGGMGLVER